MKIRTLIDRIQTQDIVLPEFQREYVWRLDQAKELMVSLFKEYPIGSILIWETQTPPDLKGFNATTQKQRGTYQVILDGQQRLTALYMLLKDNPPPFYKETEIENDPRQLYFNLLTSEFRYYQVSVMSLDKSWVCVKEVFLGNVDAVVIALDMSSDSTEEVKSLVSAFSKNHQRLLNIAERDFPDLRVPITADVDDAIDVFDRVNSQGTKLTEAELALAHISGRWTTARREMKELIDRLSKKGFIFDLSFMVRCLTAVIHWRGELSKIHNTDKDTLIKGWKQVTATLDYLTELLPTHAYINGTDDLNTLFVLIPLVAFIVKRGGILSKENEIKQALHWFYAAHMWARYSSSPNEKTDHDIVVVANNDFPFEELEKQVIEQRGRIKVESGDLEGRSIQQPFYRMAHVVAKYRRAVDWFNGLPLARSVGKSYSIQSHHVFPISRLYEEGGYKGNNHLHVKIVNEIANRVFITEKTNREINNRLPVEYLPEIEERYPKALWAQFIPDDPELWHIENYKGFLEVRRDLIAQAINDYMDSLLREPSKSTKPTLTELLRKSEGPTLEFKSTLRYDLRRNEENNTLEKVVVKTIAGFLNSEGGTLLIGVEDAGELVGIEVDFQTLKKQNRDGFELKLTEIITKFLGENARNYCTVEFEKIEEKTICRVDMNSSPFPIYLTDGERKYFYVRTGNSTRPYEMDEAHQYIAQHWTS
ncbi:MAG: DUF262 domain-containing protein [bacterium]|nr:DUF262 domain-containing protein [bacterium]